MYAEPSLALTSSPLINTTPVLISLRWQDLQPAIDAAEQIDQTIVEELQIAHHAFREKSGVAQQQQLQIAVNKTIDKLQQDYQQVIKRKTQAEQRLFASRTASTSYLSQFGYWARSSLQRFFSSDDASLITRYGEIAQKRQENIEALIHYRDSLESETQQNVSLMAHTQTQLDIHPRAHQLSTINSDEFQVSDFVTSAVEMPSTGTFSNGNFVITWSSFNPINNSWGVYAQRYDTDGARLGSELLVNLYSASDVYYDINVGVFKNDGFVITWTCASVNGSWYVYARRYNASGDPLGDPFQVNMYEESARSPSVATFSNGGFVISWQSTQGNNTVYAQRYSPSGDALGRAFLVSANTTGDQMVSSVGTFSNGDFVVAWQSQQQNTPDYYGVYAQRYNASGDMLGPEFLVSTNTTGSRYGSGPTPKVGTFSDGSFVIVWSSYPSSTNNCSVYAQRYKASGSLLDSHFQVNLYTEQEAQCNASIGTFSDGRFVIAWQGRESGDTFYNIYAKYYSASATLLDDGHANEDQSGDKYYPSVSTFSDGGYLIAWLSYQLSNNIRIVNARLFSGPYTPPTPPTSSWPIVIAILGILVSMPVLAGCIYGLCCRRSFVRVNIKSAKKLDELKEELLSGEQQHEHEKSTLEMTPLSEEQKTSDLYLKPSSSEHPCCACVCPECVCACLRSVYACLWSVCAYLEYACVCLRRAVEGSLEMTQPSKEQKTSDLHLESSSTEDSSHFLISLSGHHHHDATEDAIEMDHHLRPPLYGFSISPIEIASPLASMGESSSSIPSKEVKEYVMASPQKHLDTWCEYHNLSKDSLKLDIIHQEACFSNSKILSRENPRYKVYMERKGFEKPASEKAKVTIDFPLDLDEQKLVETIPISGIGEIKLNLRSKKQEIEYEQKLEWKTVGLFYENSAYKPRIFIEKQMRCIYFNYSVLIGIHNPKTSDPPIIDIFKPLLNNKNGLYHQDNEDKICFKVAGKIDYPFYSYSLEREKQSKPVSDIAYRAFELT